ncbi:MAG: hypothetical protein ACXVGN_00505 [Mycobacteriaceae bacterium]
MRFTAPHLRKGWSRHFRGRVRHVVGRGRPVRDGADGSSSSTARATRSAAPTRGPGEPRKRILSSPQEANKPSNRAIHNSANKWVSRLSEPAGRGRWESAARTGQAAAAFCVGVERAWGDRKPTGLAVADGEGCLLQVSTAGTDEAIVAALAAYVEEDCLVAIDAP